MILFFFAKRLALPELNGLLALLYSWLLLLLGLRGVAALTTLVVCHIGICSIYLMSLLAVVSVMDPIFYPFYLVGPATPTGLSMLMC